MAFNQTESKVTLGDEFDDKLRENLMRVLKDLGATACDSSRLVAGSQDIEEFDALIGGKKIHVQAETYLGLSVSGPNDIVEKIQKLVTKS